MFQHEQPAGGYEDAEEEHETSERPNRRGGAHAAVQSHVPGDHLSQARQVSRYSPVACTWRPSVTNSTSQQVHKLYLEMFLLWI
jgi:hypothetical protein